MKKVLASLLLVIALLAMTAGTVFAQDPTPIIGTVESVEFGTDPTTDETIVIVSVLDETTGESQTVNLSLETAAALGLVATDPVTGEPIIDPVTGEPVVADDAVGMEVEIAPEDVLPSDEEVVEEDHPVGSALSDFFSELLGVDYETIMTIHEEGVGDDGHGVGFGVIAQALWLTNQIDGGTEEFEALIEAKQTHDYSEIILADGTTPDNWGDVVKSLKKGENLGSVMSGKAESGEETPTETPTEGTTETTLEATGNENDNGNGGGSNGHGNNGKGNKGKGKGGGKGGGKP